jgi:hypothetical protein
MPMQLQALSSARRTQPSGKKACHYIHHVQSTLLIWNLSPFTEPLPEVASSAHEPLTLNLWHSRMGHIGMSAVVQLVGLERG